MLVCHMEAMKEIRALEDEKEMILDNECERHVVSYKEGEQKVDTGYSYEETRRRVSEIDSRIRKIRCALTLANCTTKIGIDDLTIGEGLVLLAQLNAEYERLTRMAHMRQLSRRITQNGTLEYTECLFDVKEVLLASADLKRRIGALQVAIDRANLNGMIEI